MTKLAMGTRMMPKPIYEALPWLYMTLGVLIVAMLEDNLKYLSALLFMAVGSGVFLMRWSVRSANMRRPVSKSAGRVRLYKD